MDTKSRLVLKVKLGLYALFCLDPFFSLWEKTKIQDNQDLTQVLTQELEGPSQVKKVLRFYKAKQIYKRTRALVKTYGLHNHTTRVPRAQQENRVRWYELQTFFVYFEYYKFLFFPSETTFLKRKELISLQNQLGFSPSNVGLKSESYPLPILALLSLEDLVLIFDL